MHLCHRVAEGLRTLAAPEIRAMPAEGRSGPEGRPSRRPWPSPCPAARPPRPPSQIRARPRCRRSREQLVCTVPELNVAMDTYRVGTLMEMIREVTFSLADVGLNTRIMVQPSMGEGIFKSLPLALSGVMAILKGMDWGEGMVGEHVRFGEVRGDRGGGTERSRGCPCVEVSMFRAYPCRWSSEIPCSEGVESLGGNRGGRIDQHRTQGVGFFSTSVPQAKVKPYEHNHYTLGGDSNGGLIRGP